MSLTQALNTSAAGLRVTQAGLALISSNVANADTPGYIRKTLVQTTVGAGAFGASVGIAGINRELDQYVQRQLRIESAGGAYADVRAQFYSRLQLLYGSPGSTTSLESTFNNFTTAMQALAASPESYSTQSGALSAAQVLAQQLNSISSDIQGLRADAESGLAEAAGSANDAMQGIARINQQLAGTVATDPGLTTLMDQRDRYIDQLAELMDIKVTEADGNQKLVFTNSGVQLAGFKAAQFEFRPQGTMTANGQWNADPTKSGVGTLTLISPTGERTDLLATNNLRSGRMAALVEMRDDVLVNAQQQLDALAATMSRALSDKTDAGTPVTAGAQSGFDLDIGGLIAGNSLKLNYTDVASGKALSVTFVRIDDPAALPYSAGDATNRIVGVNFSGGPASVATQIATALGAGFTASNTAGNTVRILDDGGATVTADAASTTRTITGLVSGNLQLPLFVDGSSSYSGAVTAGGSQMTGLAGRIAVNAALLADPSKLVGYAASTAAGDAARPAFLQNQLTLASLNFSAGIGAGQNSSVQATLPGYLRQVISQQGQDAAAASNLQQGQQVVVDALRQRMNDTSQVNIDQEMTDLLRLQSAYSANARVLSAVKEMLDLLSKL